MPLKSNSCPWVSPPADFVYWGSKSDSRQLMVRPSSFAPGAGAGQLLVKSQVGGSTLVLSIPPRDSQILTVSLSLRGLGLQV